jgi:adenylate cyclase
MGLEIEKKFLVVKGVDWKELAQGELYRQGYLNSEKERTVRVRTVGDKGFLTIKGRAKGAVRPEYEYEIPFDEADEMLNRLCERPLIEKYRYKIPYQGLVWEVDEFLGENAGLVVAEVELESQDQVIHHPEWVGREVTGDERYYNSNLIKLPFSKW